MEILRGLVNLRKHYPNPVVTIGNFDGVHLGHQALFAKTMERAKALNGTSIAMTFEPHPMRVLRPSVNLPLITPLEQKLKLIDECGLDVCVCVRFGPDFAELSADNFVDKLLVGRFKAASVVVGYDFRFGKNGLGDIELLRLKGETHGFEVHKVGPVMVDDRPVSSTRVRQEVRESNMAQARGLLSRHYRIASRVISGFGRGGRLLGFPTANLEVADELIPGGGVYAVLVELADGRIKQGVTNIGTNPTFENAVLSVETHLLDFDEDIYGEDIVVQFVEHLRGEKKFNGIDELTAQIKQDCQSAREILETWA